MAAVVGEVRVVGIRIPKIQSDTSSSSSSSKVVVIVVVVVVVAIVVDCL